MRESRSTFVISLGKVFGLVLLVFACLCGAVLSAYSQTNDECLTCHGEQSLTMEKGGKTISLHVNAKLFAGSAHGDLTCVSCHEGFNPGDLPHAKKITGVRCLSCHEGSNLEKYSKSVHGTVAKDGTAAARCVDCHTTHAVQKLSALDPVARKEFDEQICARCHGNVAVKYLQSDHGQALARGDRGAPSCINCHGEHGVQASSTKGALTSRVKEAETCLGCHLDNAVVRGRVGPSAGFIADYRNSVHGQAIKGGNDMGATCSDCHTAHEVRKGSNPASGVARLRIAGTCAKCHGTVRDEYEKSIHGSALARGVTASPTCTDCHGEHAILSPSDSKSPVAAVNVSAQVCTPCHGSLRLTKKYGLAGDRFSTFMDSYHGLASKAGSMEVANCASCHGVHDIKPSSDSTSRVSPANLAKTCGKCHPGANENFTRGQVHVLATSGQDQILYLVSSGYIILIFVTIGGMFVHNLFDFIKKSARKLAERRGEITRKHVPHRLYVRMTGNERFQHATLLTSFLTLVLTGFALRFPDAWWVAPLRSISPWVFELRGIMHRLAAAVLVFASLYHIYYILLVPRGKQLVKDLLPVRKDLTDAVDVFRYNFGLSRERPRLGRFSYVEKSEYWALVWGTIVMSVTGVILWADNLFLGLITKLWWDVARTVHYYEAWLATLSIIVWHFYFVIFNPDTYPINLAFVKGTLTEEEMEEEHPLELEAIRAAQVKAAEAGQPGGQG